MKTWKFAILLPVTTAFLIIGCKDQKETAESKISGSLINNSECKSLKSGDLKAGIADTLSCVDYTYDASNRRVIMKHINAGFNCCPVSISCEVSTNNDTIIIREKEQEQACNCNCLFDLDIELEGVGQNNYQVRFIEPYAAGQEGLIFEMDLTLNNEGEYCVVRKWYPWGE